jgi:hypothetical protein
MRSDHFSRLVRREHAERGRLGADGGIAKRGRCRIQITQSGVGRAIEDRPRPK